jgi:hypothetical protein
MFVLSFLVRIETKQRVAVVIVGQNRNKKTSGCIYAEALYWDHWFAEKLNYLWLYLCDGIVVLTSLVRWCVKTNSCFISVAWLCCHCRSRKKQSKVSGCVHTEVLCCHCGSNERNNTNIGCISVVVWFYCCHVVVINKLLWLYGCGGSAGQDRKKQRLVLFIMWCYVDIFG